MNLFFQIVITAYLFFLVPVFMGAFEAAVFRKKKRVSEIVTNGYVIMFALFCILAVVFVRQEYALSMLARVWIIVTAISSLLALLAGRKVLKEMLTECKIFLQSGKKCILLVAMVSIFASIGFTKPSTDDITALIVASSVQTDGMYLVNPYSGEMSGILDASKASSPIEMLYAVGTMLAGADSQMFIYYMLPVALLSLFFFAMWRVASTFFEKEEQRLRFVGVITVIYWMTTYMNGRTLMTGIFLNSWNGVTLLGCIILPLVFSWVLELMHQAENGIKNIPAKLEKCVLAAVWILAAQLTNSKGGFYVMLMLFLCVAVIIVKGGYTYGVKTGRFKKCI